MKGEGEGSGVVPLLYFLEFSGVVGGIPRGAAGGSTGGEWYSGASIGVHDSRSRGVVDFVDFRSFVVVQR